MNIPAWLPRVVAFISAAFMLGFIIAGYLLVQVSRTLPDVETIKGVELKIPLRVYSAEGILISEFGDERRKPVELTETPQDLINAVLASEDDRFFHHSGIDISGLVRAAISNFRSGVSQQGASTITMQVARNFFLTREKTYIRKLREVLLAFKLERILTKDDILHLYLNKIFLGHRAYGFGAAADVYYGRELNDLSLSELAMLAGLPKAPSSNNPLRNPARAITRRNYVLGRMLELEHITADQFELASNAPVTAEKHARTTDLNAHHIAEMVRAELLKQFGESAYWAGLDVHTTIQAEPQRQAQLSLRAGLQDYDKRHGFRGPIAQLDLPKLTQDPDEDAQLLGELLADYPDSQEQKPAIVTALTKQSATVFNTDLGTVTLALDDSRWAKRHLTANSVGERPTSMAKLLNPGDVIYIEPLAGTDNAKPSESAASSWRLSQIPNISGALISIEPASGRILSLVGGYDFFLNKFNRAIQSIRQPGSNIKPFIYSAALDNGFSAASLISGAPIVLTDPTHGTVWRPENYSGEFYGPTRMREALAKSMNLVSVRLLRSIGIPYTREYLERFGINMNRFSSSLTMALGSGGITPLELLSAYGVIANGGYRVTPYFIQRIVDRNGEVVFQAASPEYCDDCYQQFLPQLDEEDAAAAADLAVDEAPAVDEEDTAQETAQPDLSQPRSYIAPRVMNRANNFVIRSILKDVITRGTARKAVSLNRQDLAGKTGTTNDYVDAWFTGFNSQVATTVWMGFDDPATLGRGEAGSKASLPVWIDYMRSALKEIKQDPQLVPEYMEQGWVNRVTGQRTDELDPNAITEYFPIEALLPEPFGQLGLTLQESDSGELENENGDPDSNDPFSNSDNRDGYGNSLNDQYDDGSLFETDSNEPQERILEQEEETEGLF